MLKLCGMSSLNYSFSAIFEAHIEDKPLQSFSSIAIQSPWRPWCQPSTSLDLFFLFFVTHYITFSNIFRHYHYYFEWESLIFMNFCIWFWAIYMYKAQSEYMNTILLTNVSVHVKSLCKNIIYYYKVFFSFHRKDNFCLIKVKRMLSISTYCN